MRKQPKALSTSCIALVLVMLAGLCSKASASSVASLGTGSGNGGTISINARSISIKGSVTADASGSGNGGEIVVNSSSTNLLTLEGATTQITAQSVSGNGGTISITNGGTIVIDDAVEIRASARGNNGLGGTITIKAGNATNASLTVSNGSLIEADGGLSTGSGGQIVLSYADDSGTRQLAVNSASVTASGNSLNDNGGSVTAQNSGTTNLNIQLDDGVLEATNGKLVFDKPDQVVSVIAQRQMSPGPLQGALTANGSDVNLSIDMGGIEANYVDVGNVQATNQVTIAFLNSGDLSRSSLFSLATNITAPTLNLKGTFRNVGSADGAPLNVDASSLNTAENSLFQRIVILNTSTDLSIGDGFTVSNFFSVTSDGGLSVGNLASTGPGQDDYDGINLVAAHGDLTFRAGSSIRAIQGSIYAETTWVGGTLIVENGVQIGADADGGNLLWGNVDLVADPPSNARTCSDGDVSDVTVLPSTASYGCGPFYYIADGTDNTLLIANRRLTIWSTLQDMLELGGNVSIAAIGNAPTP